MHAEIIGFRINLAVNFDVTSICQLQITLLIRAIVDAYDVEPQAETYFADYNPGEDFREFPKAEPTDQIDDLFDHS